MTKAGSPERVLKKHAPKRSLKSGPKIIPYLLGLYSNLRDPQFAADYIVEAANTGDEAVLRLAVSDLLGAVRITPSLPDWDIREEAAPEARGPNSSLEQNSMIKPICEATDEERRPMWCTGPQLAERLRVSVRTIANWTEDGTLPVYRKGRVVRYDLSECMQALRVFRRKSQFEGQDGME